MTESEIIIYYFLGVLITMGLCFLKSPTEPIEESIVIILYWPLTLIPFILSWLLEIFYKFRR